MWGVGKPEEARQIIERQKADAVALLNGREPQSLEEQALVTVGKDIFDFMIKEYTEKQWGRPCKDLPPSIIKRLPVRFTFDNNYFDDKYQGIPSGGYNILINGLLQGCEIVTDTDFFDSPFKKWRQFADKLVYTGPVDRFFDYCYGHLDWRSVSFKTRIENTANYQGVAVVNYTSLDKPYTRIIEHKHFEMFGPDVEKIPVSVISEEYSEEYCEGMEPFYAVNDEKNNVLYAKYKELAGKESDILFGGRLAEYKYYDMAPVIERALSVTF